ncbi:MAG TPA: hypothetical protein VGB24_14680 [Longimicrobium sp.]|jgi:hypothetical protein|uniref:hypothetical protein n=1 Tax=Longimicrobium sp. TaxID=2029185 RepID=UPI002EDB946C
MISMTMRRRFALIPLLFAASACSDITGGGEAVAGLVIEDAGGTALVTVGATGVTGTLSVNQGAERDLEVVLLSAAGVPVGLGLSQSIRVTVVNSQVAAWEGTDGTSGTLVGRSRGNTTLRVDVISAGAVDYGSPSIPVRVN